MNFEPVRDFNKLISSLIMYVINTKIHWGDGRKCTYNLPLLIIDDNTIKSRKIFIESFEFNDIVELFLNLCILSRLILAQIKRAPPMPMHSCDAKCQEYIRDAYDKIYHNNKVK